VNEAYLHLAGQTNSQWENRQHFLAGAARMMRHILVSHARSRQTAKRGGGVKKVELTETTVVSENQADEVLALNEALDQLAQLDRRKAQVVELKYFAGMSYEEIAKVLDISEITVRRDWEFARTWLHRELTSAA
jgi:RNA polymerase sigma factor (TIGR02999 family)